MESKLSSLFGIDSQVSDPSINFINILSNGKFDLEGSFTRYTKQVGKEVDLEIEEFE